MDAMHVLKSVIGRDVSKEKGNAFVFFADIKPAVDRIKRGELWRMMNRLGVEKQLRNNIR